jgi:DUF1680 family protein
MRLLAAWEQYLATADADGIQIHQLAAATIEAPVAGSDVRLSVATDYPWDGRVVIRVEATPATPWMLSLRVPPGVDRAILTVDGDGPQDILGERIVHERRVWQAGDEVILDLGLATTVTPSDPRVDATRGCVAVQRGPLVYAIETADLPDGPELEDVEVEPDVAPVAVARDDIAPGLVGLSMPAHVRRGAGGRARRAPDTIEVRAIPYFAWANRRVEAMRVWIPTTTGNGHAPAGGDADDAGR